MQLDGKVGIVTGGGGAIGEAIVEQMVGAGARVVVADLRAEDAARVVKRFGEAAVAVTVDVTDPGAVASMVEQTLTHWGKIDALVCSSGVSMRSPFLETDLATWQRALAVNLTGPFLCGQAVARQMVRSGGGAIVNVASISGQRAGTNRTAYGTSKAGLIMLTRQMAIELGEHGVRVNAISPGPVDTPMSRRTHSKEQRQAYHRQIPLHRYGMASEMARAAVFLLTDDASFINGHVLNVDGGFDAAGLIAV